MARSDELDDVDPSAVTAVRAGNALWPGLAAFTGVSFLVYLLVKLAAGTVAFDTGFVVQIAVSIALLAAGGVALMRARYFYVELETPDGKRRAAGLTKAERDALAARFEGAGRA